MCGVSWVFNNILIMANDLIMNLNYTGTPVGFGLIEIAKQFIEISIELCKEDHYGKIPHKLRNGHLEDECLTLYSALSILCWDSMYYLTIS
jgi:hypothetical protein